MSRLLASIVMAPLIVSVMRDFLEAGNHVQVRVWIFASPLFTLYPSHQSIYRKTNRLFIPIDINECTTATHNCHGVAHCYNTEGSFSCSCREGYTGDGILNCEPLGMVKKVTLFIRDIHYVVRVYFNGKYGKIRGLIYLSQPQRNVTTILAIIPIDR